MEKLRLFLLSLLICITSGIYAQSNGDILFSKAQDLQSQGIKKQSKSTLDKAIAKYNAAKKAYSSSSEKAKCDKQIQICKDMKASIGKPNPKPNPDPTPKDEEKKPKPVVINDAKISLSESTLTFKKTSVNEPQTIEVECNYDDWTIEASEWIKCTKNDSKHLTISCMSENEDENPRNGSVKIVCHNATAELTVMQDVKKIFGSIKVDDINFLKKKKKNKKTNDY